MKKELIAEKVKRAIEHNLKKRGISAKIDGKQLLISAGIIDSLGALELVAEIEKIFGIKINGEELTESNFDSIEKIVDLISRK